MARRRAAVGHLADHDLELLLLLALPQRLLPGRPGAADGGAVRARARAGVAAAGTLAGRAGRGDGDGGRRRRLQRVPGARGCRGPPLGRGHQRAGRGGGTDVSRPLPPSATAPLERPPRPRPVRRGAPARNGLGLGDGRGRRARPLRCSVPAGGGDGRGALGVGSARSPAGPPWPRPRRTSGPPRAWTRPRPRPRSASTSSPPVANTSRWVGSRARCRARRCPCSSQYVREGRVVDVLVPVAPLTRNPDMRWVLAHCRAETGTPATVRDRGRHVPALRVPGRVGSLSRVRRRGNVGWRWPSRWSRSPCPR